MSANMTMIATLDRNFGAPAYGRIYGHLLMLRRITNAGLLPATSSQTLDNHLGNKAYRTSLFAIPTDIV